MPDIVCINETWIPDSRDCDSFRIDNYVTFADCQVGKRGGGGTLMLVKTELQPTLWLITITTAAISVTLLEFI